MINQVVIVGGGPVGNFSALLSSLFQIPTVVYEKRSAYTRKINLKIKEDFFDQIYSRFSKLSRNKDPFFRQLNELLVANDNKIKLNELESALKMKAQELGATYIQEKQIKSFQEVSQIHPNSIILDCAGRHSPLRINQFGADDENMRILNLQSVIHINFQAKISNNFNFQLLYPAFKYCPHLKVGEIVVSKKIGEEGNDYSHITIPIAIEDELAKQFDREFPNINRVPLQPFVFSKDSKKIPNEIEEAIGSIFCPLAMERWGIKWETVEIKKINITCGYSRVRSKQKFICLGDSAAHFAYFKSLNIGLKHAADFFSVLSMYPKVKLKLGAFNEEEVTKQFKKKNPLLLVKSAREGQRPGEYLFTIHGVIQGGYIFDIRDSSTTILNVFSKAENNFKKYEDEVMGYNWKYYLDMFEANREKDIERNISSNKKKKNEAEVISYIIWLNGLSPFKFSEGYSYITKGYFIDKKDLQFFCRNYLILKYSIADERAFVKQLMLCLKQLEEGPEIKKRYQGLQQRFNWREFIEATRKLGQQEQLMKSSKQGSLLMKIFEIVASMVPQKMEEEK